MKCLILLHSTTGNTKLIARYASKYLEKIGVTTTLLNIAKTTELPEIDDIDVLCVACPTMYFRPTYVMERFVSRMPNSPNGQKPAFLLATAGGDAGAHFELLADQLKHKDWITLGAHLVVFPNNWPSHRAFVHGLNKAEPLAQLATQRFHKLSDITGLLWPDVSDASPNAPKKLEAFIDSMIDRARRTQDTGFAWAPSASELYKGVRVTKIAGRMITVDMMREYTDITINSDRCTQCGTCVNVCPVKCITRETEEETPRVGEGCTGCWACFNACPDGAISGWAAQDGKGRYRGPTQSARQIFSF